MADNGRVEMIRIPRCVWVTTQYAWQRCIGLAWVHYRVQRTLTPPREEEVYAKEDVFGRDAASVFPNAAKEATTLDTDRVKELIGSTNFISESQVCIGIWLGFMPCGIWR